MADHGLRDQCALDAALASKTPHLGGEARNPRKNLPSFGNHHAVLGGGMRSDHEIHIADGLALTFQRGVSVGMVVSRNDGPGPHAEAGQPRFDGWANFAAPSLAVPKHNSAPRRLPTARPDRD